jgi:hypothetical protein
MKARCSCTRAVACPAACLCRPPTSAGEHPPRGGVPGALGFAMITVSARPRAVSSCLTARMRSPARTGRLPIEQATTSQRRLSPASSAAPKTRAGMPSSIGNHPVGLLRSADDRRPTAARQAAGGLTSRSAADVRRRLGSRELGCSSRGVVPAGCPRCMRGAARTPPRRSPSDGLRAGPDGARSTRPTVRSRSARHVARMEGESWSPSLTSRIPARRPGVAARVGRRTRTAANGPVRVPAARALDSRPEHRGGSDREAHGLDPQAQKCVQAATRAERMSGST